MSSIAEKTPANKSFWSEEQINELSKKWYGLTDKDITELAEFINEFDEAGSGVAENPVYDDLKPLVDAGNKIPSHCGFMIMSYYANRHGDDAFNSLMLKVYSVFKEENEKDAESTNTTDLYELLACMILFSPHKALRKFVQKHFATAEEILKIMRKRPATASVLMGRYAELFVASKHDVKYSSSIVATFKNMIEFLKEKNGITEEIPDAVNVNFNELRNIISEYLDAGNKKESLKKVNNLINKKADIGQAMFDWISVNPSCALDVIQNTEAFNGDLLVLFFQQMKIQHILESMILIQFLTDDKIQQPVEYIKTKYRLETFDDYFDRLITIAQKEGIFHYGILLRHVEYLPNIPVNSSENVIDAMNTLQEKLSSVANNLTADISEKSMSITIAPLGRSRVYQDIEDSLMGVDSSGEGGGGGFLAKLRDKDVVKKIRESGISYLAVDQYTGSVMISLIDIMKDVVKKQNMNDIKLFEKECYREAVTKYGIIYTLPYFNYVIGALVGKFQSNNANVTTDEDYEDIQA